MFWIVNEQSRINQIVEVFIKMHEMLTTHKELFLKIIDLEKKASSHDDKIMLVFEYLKQLEQAKQQELEQKHRPKIGYKKGEWESPQAIKRHKPKSFMSSSATATASAAFSCHIFCLFPYHAQQKNAPGKKLPQACFNIMWSYKTPHGYIIDF